MTSYPLRSLSEALVLDIDEVQVSEDDVYRIAGVYGFGRGIFQRGPIEGRETSYKKLNRLHTGHIVMSRLKAFEGAISEVPSAFDGWFLSPEFPTFRVLESEADVDYVGLICKWPFFWRMLSSESEGIGSRRERVSAQRLLSIKVPIPDLDTQRRLTRKFRKFVKSADSLHAKAEQFSLDRIQMVAIAGIEQIMLRRADGNVKVREVCELISDIIHPGQDPGSAREFVGLEHISPHFGLRIGGRPVGEEKGRKFRFAPGDVLYGYLRPYLNKVWLADRHGLCSVEQYVLRPNGVLLPQLISYGLRSRSTLDYTRSLTNNLQLPRLRSSLLLDAEIPYIRADRQAAVAAELDSYMERIGQLVELHHRREGLRAALLPSFLNAAFNGQL